MILSASSIILNVFTLIKMSKSEERIRQYRNHCNESERKITNRRKYPYAPDILKEMIREGVIKINRYL